MERRDALERRFGNARTWQAYILDHFFGNQLRDTIAGAIASLNQSVVRLQPLLKACFLEIKLVSALFEFIHSFSGLEVHTNWKPSL